MLLRITDAKHERNTMALRALVDVGSSRVVRDPVVGSRLGAKRRKYPLPGIGHRSGKLTVTGYLAGNSGGFEALIVKCECGRPEYTVDGHNFRNFKSTRCNICAKKSSTRTRKLYWGYSDVLPNDEHRERLLNRLSSAITRCHTKTNPAYPGYGGRGISVFRAWREDRREFLRYVQTVPGWDHPSLEMDRHDNDGNYEPGNIRFITRSENAYNKRKVNVLQKDLDDLRSRLRRAEEQVHSCDTCRAAYRS